MGLLPEPIIWFDFGKTAARRSFCLCCNVSGMGSKRVLGIDPGETKSGCPLCPLNLLHLSPEGFFFANSTTLYVADSGDGKQTSATSSIGDGGLQKWTENLNTGVWTLDYTLSIGLNLVLNTANCGGTGTGACTTGLEALTGELIDGGTEVELFATNYTLGDLNSTFLYSITDVLSDTINPGNEDFNLLATAPADSNFKGVAFAPSGADLLTPTPLPASWTIMLIGLAGLGWAAMRRGSNVSCSAWV